MPRCIAIVPLFIVAVNASCGESGVDRVWSEVRSVAGEGMAALVEDPSMCQYIDILKTCDEKATEQACMLGSDCVWSEQSKCAAAGHVAYEALLNPWAQVAASAAGKFLKTVCYDNRKQSDCSNNCEWRNDACGVASKFYTDMCSNADVKSTVELLEPCVAMTGTCTGDCESDGYGGCRLKRSKLVASMFGDFAETLTTARDEVATCTPAEGPCLAGCSKNFYGCSKQVVPIIATMTSQSEICEGKTESTQCTSQCEWKKTGDEGEECTLSIAWGHEECKVKGGYIDFAPSSFEPVPMLLSIIAMHVAAYM